MLKTSEMTSNSNVTWFARTNRAQFFWFLLHVWFRWRLGEKWRQIYHSDSRSWYLQVAYSWFKPASGGGFLLFCCRLLCSTTEKCSLFGTSFLYPPKPPKTDSVATLFSPKRNHRTKRPTESSAGPFHQPSLQPLRFAHNLHPLPAMSRSKSVGRYITHQWNFNSTRVSVV